MKQTCICLFLIVMYSVAGVLSISTQTTEDKFVAHQKNIRELVLRLLCNALDPSNSAAVGEQGSTRADELLLTSADLDRRVFLNGIRCRMRSPHASVDDDDDNDDEVVDVHLRRQVDPLHSCIEAKCSSWNSGNYLDCIYRHCISSFQLGLKSRFLVSKRNARTSVMKDHLKTSKEDDKERQSTLREGSLEEEDGEGSGHVVTATAGSSSSNGLEARLRVMRRGFNDIADVCVQHHCGSFNSHSMDFFSCVESHCAFR